MPKNHPTSLPAFESGEGSPSRIFVETIQYTGRNGDLLDQVKWFKRSRAVGSVALAATALASAQTDNLEGIGTNLDTSHMTVVLLMAGGLAGSRLTRRFSQRRQETAITKFGRSYVALSKYLEGDALEIYRDGSSLSPSYKLHLAWEPTDEKKCSPEAVAESLQKISKLVEKQPVSSIAIPNSALKDIKGAEIDIDEVRQVTRGQWLREMKSRPIDDRQRNDSMRVFSKVDLMKFVDGIEVPKPEPVDVYMDILRRLQPNHPTLKHYDESNRNGRLQKSLERIIEIRMMETDVRLTRGSSNEPLKEKYLKTGQPVIVKGASALRWRTANGLETGGVSSLLGHANLTVEQLQKLPENYKDYPKHQAVLMCEIAAWMASKNLIETDTTSTFRANTKASSFNEQSITEQIPGMQLRIAQCLLIDGQTMRPGATSGINIDMSNFRRYGSSLLSLFVAWGLGSSAYKVVDLVAGDKPIPRSAKQIGQTVDQKASQWLEGSIEKINISSHTNDEINEYANKEAQNRAAIDYVGNVPQVKNKPLWHVRSYNGMQSEGYWRENTSFMVSEDPISWRSSSSEITEALLGDYGLTASSTELINERKELPLSSSIDIAAQPLLQIEKIISPNIVDDQKGFSENGAYETGQGGYMKIPIPVLEGTRVIAADVDNEANVILEMREDGSTILLVPRALAHETVDITKLQYWLTPEPSTRGMLFQGVINEKTGYNVQPPNKVWKEVIPKIETLPVEARIEAQLSHLRSFDYRLKPLSSNKALKDFDLYAQHTLARRQANCNTANSLLVLSNPQELNYATGFQNSNSSTQTKRNQMYLSSAEAHAWAVNTQGHIYDATPTNVDPQEQSFFNEDFATPFTDPLENRVKGITYISLGLIGLSAIGIGYAGRHAVKRSSKKLLISALSSNMKARSYYTLNSSLYGEGTSRRYPLNTALDSKNIDKKWQTFKKTHDYQKVRRHIKQNLSENNDKRARRELVCASILMKTYVVRTSN